MDLPTMAPVSQPEPTSVFKDGGSEVVEIALLLPVRRAEALVALSRRRRQSVGVILRQLIDRALLDEE